MSAQPPEEEEETIAASLAKELVAFKEKFKNEDEEYSPFQGVEKNAVLHDAKVFNDHEVVKRNPGRCRAILTKLLYIIHMGDTFEGSEATEVFFGVTKLFQSQDAMLRRMVYLFVREVAESTSNEEIIIVVASLTKDMTSSNDLYRGNAIRVLSRIIDGNMLGQLDRYIKQAVVDRSPIVASAALTAGLHFARESPEIIRRWVSEIQQALSSPNANVQYHALLLLYQTRSHDRLAISKLVSQLWNERRLGDLATCQLIRYTVALATDPGNSVNPSACMAFLESCLRHKSDAVTYEAARAVCHFPGVSEDQVGPAISVLQLLMASPKPVLRFAATRTLNHIAEAFPSAAAKCNDDLELLIGDANRSIATLAITTLLKTGTEGSVERLMKEMRSFITDISDDFKRVVVRAVRELCVRYPGKYRMLFMFLTNVLREEGSFSLKNEVVDIFLHLMDKLPSVREHGYFHLCELIEDCEYTRLSTRVLHVLGEKGPDTNIAARLVRSISNRRILENAWIRAAAVTALSRFAARCPDLRASILVLLTRTSFDGDDEVRDRAALARLALSDETRAEAHATPPSLPASPAAMRRALVLLRAHPELGPVTADRVRQAVSADTEGEAAGADGGGGRGGARGAGKSGTRAGAAGTDVAAGAGAGSAMEAQAAVMAVPQLAGLGVPHRSQAPAPLTERETEYVVSVAKHAYPGRLVLQFSVKNTLEAQQIDDVAVDLDVGAMDGTVTVERCIPAPAVRTGETEFSYVVLRIDGFPHGELPCELKFRLREVDPDTGAPDEDDEGFSEEYPLEAVDVSPADWMAPTTVADPKSTWATLGEEGEVEETFLLRQDSLQSATDAVIRHLGMAPLLNTGAVAAGAPSHRLALSGTFADGAVAMARGKLAPAQGGVSLLVKVRSPDSGLSQMIADCIG